MQPLSVSLWEKERKARNPLVVSERRSAKVQPLRTMPLHATIQRLFVVGRSASFPHLDVRVCGYADTESVLTFSFDIPDMNQALGRAYASLLACQLAPDEPTEQDCMPGRVYQFPSR